MHKKSPVRGGENFAFIPFTKFFCERRANITALPQIILGLKKGLKYSK